MRGSYWLEKRIRSVGHIRVFAACGALLAATAILHGLWVNPWAWLFLGAAALGLALFIAYRLWRREPVKAPEEQEPYTPLVPMVESTHYINELDPRHGPYQYELNLEGELEDAQEAPELQPA